MGLLSGSVSLMPYRVTGALERLQDNDWLGQRLTMMGFRPIDQTAEELSAGWVQLADPHASDFVGRQDFVRDNYLCFSLRMDRRRIPGALLRQEYDLAAQAFLDSRPGMRRVPKAKREELKEQLRLSLLARSLPVPSMVDILLDRRSNRLWVLSLNRQALDSFETLFGKTFEGLQLAPIAPMDLAMSCLDEAEQPALQALDQARDGSFLERVEGNRWLGHDFLLWLFHRTLTTSSDYVVRRPGPGLEGAGFNAYLNDRLVLAAVDGEGRQRIAIAGPQTIFAEARTALSHGKSLEEGTLYLEKDRDQWRFTLKADRMTWSSLRCPVSAPDLDVDDQEQLAALAEFYARTGAIEEGLQLFESLLQAFLRERIAEDWPRREGVIRNWLQQPA